MPLIHKHCGGFISGWGRCDKCGKHWNFLVFWLNPAVQKNVQYKKASSEDIVRKIAERRSKGSYATWADKLPGVGAIASVLPHWPRKVRITVTLALLVAVILLIIFV